MSTMSKRIRDAVHGAVTKVMNGCAPLLPPLSWTMIDRIDRRVTGMAHYMSYSESEIVDVLARWAAYWELTPSGEQLDGTLEYVGTIEGQAVEIWGIVDHTAYDAACGLVTSPLDTGVARSG